MNNLSLTNYDNLFSSVFSKELNDNNIFESLSCIDSAINWRKLSPTDLENLFYNCKKVESNTNLIKGKIYYNIQQNIKNYLWADGTTFDDYIRKNEKSSRAVYDWIDFYKVNQIINNSGIGTYKDDGTFIKVLPSTQHKTRELTKLNEEDIVTVWQSILHDITNYLKSELIEVNEKTISKHLKQKIVTEKIQIFKNNKRNGKVSVLTELFSSLELPKKEKNKENKQDEQNIAEILNSQKIAKEKYQMSQYKTKIDRSLTAIEDMSNFIRKELTISSVRELKKSHDIYGEVSTLKRIKEITEQLILDIENSLSKEDVPTIDI